MPTIKAIRARRILNSRAEYTIEVLVEAGTVHGRASVPSGASVGTREAKALPADRAMDVVNSKISPLLRGMDISNQEAIDNKMIQADGTPDKRRLGGNAMLGVSLACCRAAAHASGRVLHDYISDIWGIKEPKMPTPYMNLINGGAHAGNALSFQEFMVAPISARSFADAIDAGVSVYQSLKDVLSKKYGRTAINVGDEGGFAPPLRHTREALDCLMKAMDASGCSISLAIDAAATQFHKGGKYHVDGRALAQDALINYYIGLAEDYPVVSIEDPFAENDWAGFAAITRELGRDLQIVGDDLFATRVGLVENGTQHRAANCMLLKPNQVGTLTEALKAAAFCFDNDYNVMVSHRSGETNDPFIADLAVGIGCGQIKAGAPCRGERTAKYNRLLEIEKSL